MEPSFHRSYQSKIKPMYVIICEEKDSLTVTVDLILPKVVTICGHAIPITQDIWDQVNSTGKYEVEDKQKCLKISIYKEGVWRVV